MTFAKETIRKMRSAAFVFCLISAVSAQDYVKSDFQVSDASQYYYQEVRISVSDTSQMFITWGMAGRGPIQYKTVSSEGTLLSLQDTVDCPADNYPGQMVHNGLGNCMVMFHGSEGNYDWSVMTQTFDPSGSEFGVSQSLDLMTGEQINIASASLNSNRQNLFGAVLPGMDSSIAVMLSETGDLLPGEVILKTAPAYPFSTVGIMTHEGDYIMAWVNSSDGHIRGQKYEANGTPSGSSFQVSDDDDGVMLPFLYTDTTGRFTVTWYGSNNGKSAIYSQLYDNNGAKLGPNNLIIDDNVPNNTNQVSADMDEDGKFIVAWQDTGNDSLFIYLQQVDHMGIPVGGKYRATSINNDMSPGGSYLPSQSSPSVKLNRDTIYLAWANSNHELSITTSVFANIRKWWIPNTAGTDKPGKANGDLVLYPNPSNGLLSLKLPPEVSGAVTINIYTSQGSLVSQRLIQVTGQEARISLPELAEGYYYLEVRTETFHMSESFIIH